jgi:hypothetical protein
LGSFVGSIFISERLALGKAGIWLGDILQTGQSLSFKSVVPSLWSASQLLTSFAL